MHLRGLVQSFIVIEEYDKLDCETRSMFRQLWQHPELANTSWSRQAATAAVHVALHNCEFALLPCQPLPSSQLHQCMQPMKGNADHRTRHVHGPLQHQRHALVTSCPQVCDHDGIKSGHV